MCGITGIIAFKDPALPELDRVEAATDTLQQRGPDSGGFYAHQRCRLGHRRLSIIDVSDAGTQPFQDASGRYTIVFNGEFFNYQEHRLILENQGHRFRSDSDTEVLLELFVREGAACLDKINGFFAFAIYDHQLEELFLARDRFGIKPMLIYQDDRMLAFASEMKALLAYGIPKEIDQTSLSHFLHLNYIPAPDTIFRNVRKLMPGYWVRISAESIREERWYEIPMPGSPMVQLVDDQAKRELMNRLENAVKLRLIADVPLGAFLSGGIDSSVVVALASRHTDHLNTFSIGFRDEPLFDETVYAEMVAKKFRTNHTVFSLSNDDLFSHLFQVLDYIDEPFADSSALAVYILSRETRKHVTVALSGDGADEMFGGYQKHRGEWQIRHGGLSGSLVSLLHPVWKALPKSRNSKLGNMVRKMDKFSEGRSMSPSDRYWRWCGYADAAYLEGIQMFEPDQAETRLRKEFHTRFVKGTADLNDILLNDMHLVLPGDMLTKVDLMSMANSLEVRVPFLDYHVVEFAFSLGSSQKINKREGKQILKDTFRDLLPPELFNRPKHGFEVPLLKWFRNELNTYIFENLLHPEFIKSQGLFRPEGIALLKQQLHSGSPGDSVARIWALLVFQHWWKKWMN
jgi:asparagine synthase (glutamine-hydrolysing)